MQLLPRDFYARPPQLVAPQLLGKLLLRRLGSTNTSGIIVETEAYLSENDPAAHSAKGRTPRNQSLYLAAGHTYIYRIHMQHCLDIVCQQPNEAGSVLIRALQPVEGVELMQKNRGRSEPRALTSGPGKLCQALQIDKNLDGIDITRPAPIQIYDVGQAYSPSQIATSARIGISSAQDLQLRFYVAGNPYLSR